MGNCNNTGSFVGAGIGVRLHAGWGDLRFACWGHRRDVPGVAQVVGPGGVKPGSVTYRTSDNPS